MNTTVNTTNTSQRKLASIQRIAEIKAIPDADRICAYRINGWWAVSQVNEYKVGDLVVYIEADAFVPTMHAAFLSKGKEPREYKGILGERLRTIKLKKQLSQGLILPLDNALSVLYGEEGDDVTDYFGIIKWEPEPEYLHSDAKGLFPSFFPKTDQERIQNCHKEMLNALEIYTWEVTEKVEGQSSSVYYYNGEVGVCSRNLELKQGNSTFWTTAEQYSLPEKLIKLGRNLVIQSEQCGPGISGNIYNFLSYHLFVFDIYDIDTGKYLAPLERRELVKQLGLESAPCITSSQMLPNSTCDSLLTYADGNSMLGNAPTLREGLVFKANTDSRITFKAVSNKYLLGQK